MQTICLNFYKKSVTPVLYAKQLDVGRKFKAIISDGTDGYAIPSNTVFTVWYSGASGEGNYDTVGDHSAFSVSGNTVTVELITQMLNNKGAGNLCLQMAMADGSQLGTWNIPYDVEGVPGAGSHPATQHNCLFAAKKEVANALKGSASGAVVALKDVSPMEHVMAVKLSSDTITDFSTITVSKHGKNLLNADQLIGNSITKDEETGVFTITQSGRAAYFNPPIPANTPITLSVKILDFYNGNYTTPLQMSLGVSSGTKYVHIGGASGEARTYTFDAPLSWLALYRYKNNETIEGAYVSFTDLQVEIGDKFTGFEPYVEPTTYTADANGDVKGVTSLAPSTTLIAESGATVTAEYNKDINKVIESLVQAIISLGGNV